MEITIMDVIQRNHLFRLLFFQSSLMVGTSSLFFSFVLIIKAFLFLPFCRLLSSF